MRMWIPLLAVILLAQITTSQSSLCITCVRTISSICVQCSATGCAPYTSFDTTTKQCNCRTGYYLNSGDSSKLYCDRCFIGCATCSGPLITNCLTCAANFTLDSSLGTCTAPMTTSDLTILRAYYFYGFNALGTWSPTAITTCGFTTLLGTTTSATPITFSTGTLKSHFQIRLMFAMYLDSSSVSTNIVIKYDSVTVKNIAVAETLTSSNPAFSCPGTKNFVQVYVDSSSAHTSTASASISISTSTVSLGFAIREIYVITKLCNGVCSSCFGYYANNCTTCADGTRLADQITSTTNYVGTCVCVGLYYEEPNAKTCVLICPTYPVQTFGDNATRKCLPNCPNNSYAYTDTYICVSDCPTLSIISGVLLFKDKLNWKCVPNCPPEAPYATKNSTFRQCFAVCPNRTNTASLFIDFYAVNGLFPQCVEVCPYNSSFWLFGYQGNCIPRCPSGTFGDPFSKLCQTNCTRASFIYKDSSTGYNICVFNCSSVNYYRDNTTYTCVLTCPSGTYGQTTRQCVTRCKDGSFGLPFGNRRCVSFCPQGWWGQPDTNVCVNTTFLCKTTTINTTNGYTRYADNYTRTCVYPFQCSFGYYADNFTQSCRPGCPNAPSPAYVNTSSVGYINMVCQVTCQTPYFADYAAGMCVTTCQTNNTYADVSSGRTCVIACNSLGLTPWANSYTRTCVSTCNSTDVPNFVSDNDTFSCVFNCPPDRYADRIATNNPICRTRCLTNTYADNSTGTGICSFGCPSEPPRFGDPNNNLCVLICTSPLFGDQTGLRLCVSQCPSGFFSQNDTTRQCVNRCKPGSYGSAFRCLTDPKDCPANQFANDATNLCDYCDASLGTWGDPTTKRCVTICPDNPSYPTAVDKSLQPITYYADSTVQQCVKVCDATVVSGGLTGTFGNNNTRYCIFKCQDLNSFAKLPTVAGGYRVCVARCYPSTLYANNQSRICVTSINCPTNQFGDNVTQACVTSCPNISWAYATANDKICIDICPTTWYGDSSTGFNVCIQKCPSIPSLFADPTTKTCQAVCPIFGGVTYYADMTTRSCVTACPVNWYKYISNRTCLAVCPTGFFGKNVSTNVGECVSTSAQCGTGLVGDPYLNLCVALCTGPNPVSYFAYGFDCISVCPNTYYSNTHNGVRECIQLCPPGSINTLAAPNLYGDNSTKSCVSRCVQPLTWADPYTRLCQSVCSASANPPLFSQNFGYTCVSSLNCPTSPSMTYGDSNTRSCVTNCSLGKFGDPVSRNCVTQCPNATIKYWSDKSTGQYICVPVCPILPRLFGQNDTNTCVDQCAPPLYGDQTGERSCIPVCPIVSGEVYFAQNISRICVTVCITGTWGYNTYRTCVENPFDCLTQWADSSTNLCVDVCPASVGTFGDPTTRLCVPLCPVTPALYFSDQTTRLCVQKCPASALDLGTFGNNETRVCESACSAFKNGTVLTYADAQTVNRYCVLQCSQSPHQAFADPSTRTCVPKCPTIPDLYGETSTYQCVSTCIGTKYADTNTRRCVSQCPGSQFKLTTPTNVCVDTCPADQAQPLYGDPSTGFCSSTCTNNTFRYSTISKCVPSCQAYNNLFVYNMTCTQFCPQGFYANSSNSTNSTGFCVPTCPGGTFGQNTTTTCETTCITGFAYNSLCIAVCPTGYYGQNKVCVTACQGGSYASNVTNTCISNCTNGTYAQLGGCFANCTTGTYADPITNTCSGSCSNSTYYADPTTSKCVNQCPTGYYTNNGYCSTTCTGVYYADNITWSCTTLCSLGYWGHNNLCIIICPQNFYAYTVNRICYSTTTLSSALTLFADNQTQTWVSVCPLTPLAFGDTGFRMCIPACLGTNLADPVSRRCEISCNNTSYFADFTTNACVLVCPDGFFANSNTGKCEAICANGYAHLYERRCVGTCPAPWSGYNNGTAKVCVGRCPLNYYSQNRVCTPTCTAPYYADNTTNECVLSCVSSFASSNQVCVTSCAPFPTYNLADNSSNQCVALCPSQPDYYSDNFICVKYCPNGTFADPTSNLRKCVTVCTSGLFSNPISGRCQAVCPLGFWGQGGTINKCEPNCTIGFADNSTGLCKTGCPSPTYADPTTLRCVKICPSGYWGEVDNTCVQKCTLPNYANPLTRRCESSCPPFNYMFAENTTASCVQNCTVVTNSYADRNVNICVQNCTLPNEYMLDIVGICTSLCPDGQFMQNSTKRCQTTCTTGFAEPTTRYCVARCFGNPQTYGYLGVCHYRCLNATVTLFADNSTNLCVSPCPAGLNYFSDPLSGNCVLWCPEGYYSQTGLRTCTTYCLTGFSDNLTRSCVGECPTATEQTFGDPSTHRCVRICPDGTYAQNTTKQCVNYNNCPNNTWSDVISKFCVSRCPSSPLYFGLNSTTSCVARCPSNLFGDYQSQTCIASCPSLNGQYRFADPISQTCVYVCPIGSSLFGDPANFSCVDTCANNWLRDNSTQRCVSVCPSSPSYWADTQSGNCVYYCPANRFASNTTARLCVSGCGILTFGDKLSQMCVERCPENYWADNSSYLCVAKCPDNPDMYADNVTKSCVYHCPQNGSYWITFADRNSRRCLTQCPDGFFGVNSTQRCQTGCPPNEYADPIIRVCVQDCTVRPHYYKTSDGKCVFQCPTTPLLSYKLNTNHTCVYTTIVSNIVVSTGCPSSQWADSLNNTCTTLCPDGYFADQVKRLCVDRCPLGTFADLTDRLCKSSCSLIPEQFRLDLSPGTCVQFCPDPYFADNSTHYCVKVCPNATKPMYSQLFTRTCVFDCPPPLYSYLPENTCRPDCPSGYFAQDSTRSCETACLPPFYADDSTNRCVLMCPDSPNYYGYQQKCRRTCPAPTFADNSTRLCVEKCPTQPQMFADNSTNKCVFNCPSTPNLYADNTTMICVYYCPNGTLAQVSTRTCVPQCPPDLDTYADYTTGKCLPSCPNNYFASDLTKQCVSLCPNTPVKTYADQVIINGTTVGFCVTQCPSDKLAQNISRTCADDCYLGGSNLHQNPSAFADRINNVCVSTCPYGYFGDNSTFQCVKGCPDNSFADNTTRRCVLACPGTEKLYADETTWRCVYSCPTGTFGNNQNWTCIPNCPPEVFGYKLDLSNLCVEECPSPYFAFQPTRTCQTNCGAGLYGDSATRVCRDCPSDCPTCESFSNCLSCNANLYLAFGTCVSSCPKGVYANLNSLSCVYAISCPGGTFGNNDTHACSSTCPTKQYANASTRVCEHCPETCESCSSTSVCLTCVPAAVFSSVTTQCYWKCSPDEIFFFNNNCQSTCPDGSYLDYTNVNCQACNSLCKTCSFSATNCTSCSTGFLLNQTCTSQCPTSFYGQNNLCLPCSPSIQACSTPLTFNVSSVTQDYQTVVYLKFNQRAIVKGDPTKFLSLKIKPSRLLQQTSVNNGVGFTATVMPDGTIRLVLDSSISLVNPSFSVQINDPSMISSASGASIQSLQADISNVVMNSYPVGSTSDAPLVVAGSALSILMLILLAAIAVCTPLPAYLTLEAFQMIAFYALVVQLPPNLFYFMKNLSMTRLSLLPNIFEGVYQEPSGFSSDIPTRVVDIDSLLGFSVTSGSYFFVLLIYGGIAGILFLASTKYNSNRPLRQLVEKIFNIRSKWGMVNDFLWMFSLNVFVCGFMQFKYTQNGGEIALAAISILIFLGMIIGMMVHHCKRFDSDDQESVRNYKFWHQGLKEGRIYRYTIFAYYIRKLLFAIVIVGTISSPAKTQCISLIAVSSIMLVLLIIIRPYQDKLRNLIHVLNQIGLTFIGGAMLYYQHYVEIMEPIGTKIICGTIITSVIIAHLSIALVWGLFKSYHFYKDMYAEFEKTQFYQLYLDEKYDESLEKELQDLNDESGEVQSVELTKVADNDIPEEENVIKLKIKRRRKINKKGEPIQSKPKAQRGGARDQGEYIRLEQSLQDQILPKKTAFSDNKFQRMMIEQQNPPVLIIQKEIQKKQEPAWQLILDGQFQRPKSRQNVFQPINDNDIISQNNDYEAMMSAGDIISRTENNQTNSRKMEGSPEFEEISSVSNKEERVSKQQGDEHLRESLRQINNDSRVSDPFREEIIEQELPNAHSPSQIKPQSEHVPDELQLVQSRISSPSRAIQDPVSNANWQQLQSDAGDKKQQQNFFQRMSIASNRPKQVVSKKQHWDIDIDQMLQQQQKKPQVKKKHMLLFDPQDFQ